MPHEVREATPADVPAMALTLAHAFHDDPIKAFLAGGKELTTERTTPFFDAFLNIQLPHGMVYTTDNHEAAAIWAPPGQWKVPITSILKYTPRFLKLYGMRFIPNLSVLTDLEKLHPTEPHYYLEFIGSRPDCRGKGYGAALMDPVLERADREGLGVYLENSKEQNLGFYGRHGFEVRHHMHHRRGGPPMWLMWRDPR